MIGAGLVVLMIMVSVGTQTRTSDLIGTKGIICASGVPAGGWGILLDPSLRFNTYLIFNNYLVIKFLSG